MLRSDAVDAIFESTVVILIIQALFLFSKIIVYSMKFEPPRFNSIIQTISGAAARIYNWGGKIYYTLSEAVHRGA